MGIEIFNKHIREKRAIKVVFSNERANSEEIAKFARAAQIGRVSAIDIPCNKEFFDKARKNTKLPIFVSSCHPFEILNAVKWGVDGIEIGNFSSLYKKGQTFNAVEIYDIILETLGIINDYEVFTCVTIPDNLNENEKTDLIRKLEILGVDLIQVEGLKVVNNNIVRNDNKTIENIDKIKDNTIISVGAVVNDISLVKETFLTGASAISLDLTDFETEVSLKADIMKVVSIISFRNSINLVIPKTVKEYLPF